VLAIAGGTLYHMNVSLWEVSSGRRLSEPLHDVDGASRELVFSRDGKTLAVEHGIKVYVIDAAAGKKTHEASGQSDLLWFGEDGQLLRLRSGAASGVPLRDGEAISLRAMPVHDPKLSFGPVRPVIAGASGLIAVPMGESVSLRDLTGKERIRLNGTNRSAVSSMAFSADGKLAAIGRENGTFDLWKL
jgi:WD40 repeat protein